jgi:hypothetical protein
MTNATIIVTASDSSYFVLLQEALASLTLLRIREHALVGILDLGMSSEQLRLLHAQSYLIRRPAWPSDFPLVDHEQYELGLVNRPHLRDYFPGFRVYLWLDADTWIQKPDFLELLVRGAMLNGTAIIRENGPGYHRAGFYKRWWYGNMNKAYGTYSGIAIGALPTINIGVLALKDTAPHWDLWSEHYKWIIGKCGRADMDQHAFNAAIYLAQLSHSSLPARFNWICAMSKPIWNSNQHLLCEPGPDLSPISVVHLAGRNKEHVYLIEQTRGNPILMPLTFYAVSKAANSNYH